MAKKTNETEKKVENLAFTIINPIDDIEIPTFKEKVVSGKEYVSWGTDNKLPAFLWDLYLNSSLLGSIIDGTTDYISGNETTINPKLEARFGKSVNKEGDTISDIIRKIAMDYLLYNGFALQVINDKAGDIAEIYWVDLKNLRLSPDSNFVYYTNKWGSYGSNDVIKYPIWKADAKEKSSIYFYKGIKSRGVYPIPRYSGAISSIMTDVQIGKFHLNNLMNNLSSSAIISFTDGKPPKAEQKKIEDKIKNKFSGSNNAGRFLVTFSNGKDTAPVITRLNEDHLDEKFQTLSKSTIQQIFIAFRATPELFGLSTENSGFSKEEYLQSFELYNKTLVLPAQKDITRVFDKIFGIEDSITINPFTIYETTNDSKLI